MKTILLILLLCCNLTFGQTIQVQIPISSGTVTTPIYFINNNTGFAGGNGFICKTINGGFNWIVSTYQWTPTQNEVTDLKFVDENTGYICTNSEKVYRTVNGGVNWTNITPSGSAMYNVEFVTANVILAQGSLGMHRSTDGGNNWNLIGIPNPQPTYVFSKIAKDSTNLYVSAYSRIHRSSSLWKSTNNGVNWIPSNSSYGEYLWDNIYAKNDHILPYGERDQINPPDSQTVGVISHFYNSIVSPMHPHNLTVNDRCLGLNILSNGHGIALSGSILNAQYSNILRTTNHGRHWNLDTVYNTKYSYMTLNNSNLYLLKQNGALLIRMNSVGINITDEEVPHSYLLYQNYPNPFNPSTTIRFDIPKDSFVKITVYNIMGKVVAKLVNEQLNAGSYEAMLNNESFSSGTYFYILHTDSYVQTKKMILVK